MRGSGRRAARDPSRRSGPADEEPWWAPDDQAIAEAPVIDRTTLGKRWQSVEMPNNVERLDPLGDDPSSEVVRVARGDRRLTGLDEGRAFRQRKTLSLVVVRTEVFASADDEDHRRAWREHGAASLDATWRERWRERAIDPGWIEANWVPLAERPDPLHAFAEVDVVSDPAAAVDWYRVEDHTDPSGQPAGRVLVYEHLTVWAGRAHVTITARHDLGTGVDEAAASAAAAAFARLSDGGRTTG